jgi:hypothetical protein
MEEIKLLESLTRELDQAQQDLFLFDKSSLDSGDANWLKDQKKYIKSLEDRIEELREGFN